MFKRFQALFLAVSIALSATTARAHDMTPSEDITFDLKELPAPLYYPGLNMACYDFEGARLLALADVAYAQSRVSLGAAQELSQELSEQRDELLAEFEEVNEDLGQAERDLRLTLELLRQSEDHARELQQRPTWPVVVLSVTAGVLGGILVGVAVGGAGGGS